MSTNAFDLLKINNKDFADKLKKAFDEANFELSEDSGIETTLLADKRQLTSHHNREESAKYRCRNLDLNKTITVYGFGLGDEIRYIFNKNKNAKVNLVILNEALFYFLLTNVDDLTELLSNDINLLIGDDDTPYVGNSIIIPSELYIDIIHNNKIKLKLANILDHDYARQFYVNTTVKFNTDNLHMNFELLKTAIPLTDEDLNKYRDREIAIIASGPSIKDNVENIKRLKDEGKLIIALDTSLAFLNTVNIVPEIIVSDDPIVYVQFKHLILDNKERFKDTLLIHSAHSETAFITDYPGKKRFIYTDEDMKVLTYLDEKGKNFVTFVGSVLLETIAIAKKIGTKRIHLFGCDFAYKGTTTHAGSLYNEVNENEENAFFSYIHVLCNDGQIQKSLKSFALYREYVEEEIKKDLSIEYINYSKTGAQIKGAKVAE